MAEKKNTPEKVSPITAIEKNSESMITLAKADLDTYFDVSYIEKVKEQYGAIEITSLKDIKGYKAMKDALKEVKRMRIDTDERRKNLTGPALKFQKDLKAHADVYIESANETESLLSDRLQAIEDLQEAEKNKLTQERSKLLTDNGFELIGKFFKCGIVDVEAETVGDLSEEDMEHYITMGKQEVERREAERKRKEAEEEQLRKDREEIEAEKAKLRQEKKEYEEFLAWKKAQEKPAEEPKDEKPVEEVKTKETPTEKPVEEVKPETAKKTVENPEKTAPAPQKKELTPEQEGFTAAKRSIYKEIDRVIITHLESKTEKITLKTVRSKVDEVKEFIAKFKID